MASDIEARLAEMDIVLPKPVAPIANYVPYVVSGTMVVISGQIPMVDGKLAYTGQVGITLGIEEATKAARQCMINLLAQLRAACDGELDRVKRVVRLGGFIAAPSSFTQHAVVMNGASDLAVAVFGDAGRHARSTVGVPSLPADAAVEVEGMFELNW